MLSELATVTTNRTHIGAFLLMYGFMMRLEISGLLGLERAKITLVAPMFIMTGPMLSEMTPVTSNYRVANITFLVGSNPLMNGSLVSTELVEISIHLGADRTPD